MVVANSVTLIGRVGKDPDMFYTQNGKACAKFSLAVENPDYNGQKMEPDWFNVTCWSDTAEHVSENIKRGMEVIVKGKVRVSKFRSKKLIDQMVSLGVKKEAADEIAIATWYEIVAFQVTSPSIAPKEEIPVFDFEEGHF